MQEELARALAQGSEDGNHEDDDKDDADSDTSSVFGLEAEDAQPAPLRRQNQKGPAAPVPTEKTSEKEKAEKPERPGRKGKADRDASKIAAAIGQAKQALTSLSLVTPAAIWKNAFKESEITTRIKKATQAETTLNQLLASADSAQKKQIQSVGRQIQSKVSGLQPLQDTGQVAIRQAGPQ